jgi:hypothetical protein
MKENTETLLLASGDVGLEINTEKTKYMIMLPEVKLDLNLNKSKELLSYELKDKQKIYYDNPCKMVE